jgi:hypothetical protein
LLAAAMLLSNFAIRQQTNWLLDGSPSQPKCKSLAL